VAWIDELIDAIREIKAQATGGQAQAMQAQAAAQAQVQAAAHQAEVQAARALHHPQAPMPTQAPPVQMSPQQQAYVAQQRALAQQQQAEAQARAQAQQQAVSPEEFAARARGVELPKEEPPVPEGGSSAGFAAQSRGPDPTPRPTNGWEEQ
jgi:hypothetical protein